MKAIILAAGRGSRMGALTNNLPKCRTLLFNKELIEWQFLSLDNKAISEIGIVTGYLKETFNFNKKQFYNNDWKNSNIVKSLLSAKDWLRNNICIIEWSNKFKKALPENRVEIDFEIISSNSRKLKFNFLGKFKKDIFKWL